MNTSQKTSIGILLVTLCILGFGIPRLVNLGSQYQKMLLDINGNMELPWIYQVMYNLTSFFVILGIALILKEILLKSNKTALNVNIGALTLSVIFLIVAFIQVQAPMNALINELTR